MDCIDGLSQYRTRVISHRFLSALLHLWLISFFFSATDQPGKLASATYHSIVFFRPFSNPVLALKPNSLNAREISSIRLGWPSGFDVSQTTPPL